MDGLFGLLGSLGGKLARAAGLFGFDGLFQLFGSSGDRLDKANGLFGLDGLFQLFGFDGGRFDKANGLAGFSGLKFVEDVGVIFGVSVTFESSEYSSKNSSRIVKFTDNASWSFTSST